MTSVYDIINENKDRFLAEAKNLSNSMVLNLINKKMITSIPRKLENVSKINKYVATPSQNGITLKYKMDFLYQSFSGQTERVIVSIINDKDIGNKYSNSISLPYRLRNEMFDYTNYNVPFVSIDYSGTSKDYFTKKEKGVILDLTNLFHYNLYKGVGKFYENYLVSQNKNKTLPLNASDSLDHLIKDAKKRSMKVFNGFFNYQLIKADRIHFSKYNIIKPYDIGKISYFFGGENLQNKTFDNQLDEDEKLRYIDKFRKLPRNEFDNLLLEVLSDATKNPEIDNKTSNEILSKGYNYVDLAYSTPEALSLFSVLLNLFFRANNEAMIENNIEDAFEWEMIKTKAFKKKDLSSEFKELVSDIETDPIYNEKKIKEQNKKEFEKRMLNLPPMKDKVAKIQRDSSISILVANGHYKEADKILKVYEKMDTNWRNALNKES